MVTGLLSSAQAHDHHPPGRFKVILAALANGDLVIPAVGVMERAVCITHAAGGLVRGPHVFMQWLRSGACFE